MVPKLGVVGLQVVPGQTIDDQFQAFPVLKLTDEQPRVRSQANPQSACSCPPVGPMDREKPEPSSLMSTSESHTGVKVVIPGQTPAAKRSTSIVSVKVESLVMSPCQIWVRFLRW